MNATKYLYRLEADARRPLPARRPVPAKRPRGARGLGVVELLISLAISATVLAAVAYAVDMTFRAYSINHEMSDLMQRTRLAMYRITTTIRTTGQCDGPCWLLAGGKACTSSGSCSNCKEDPSNK